MYSIYEPSCIATIKSGCDALLCCINSTYHFAAFPITGIVFAIHQASSSYPSPKEKDGTSYL